MRVNVLGTISIANMIKNRTVSILSTTIKEEGRAENKCWGEVGRRGKEIISVNYNEVWCKM